MRHGKIKHRIGTDSSHRKELLRNLALQVIEHGKIKTTRTRCKALRPVVEKLITLAKVDTVANRRLAFSRLGSKQAVKKLFEEVAPKFKDRNGGYTRTFRLPDGRVGDNAPMGWISLLN